MITLFLHDGPYNRGERGYSLLRERALLFATEAFPALDPEAIRQGEIRKGPGGKPYFPSLPIHFSLSHSQRIWMCAYSTQPCGLDVQAMEDVRHQALADRFFTASEQAYVEEHGPQGFFQLWVRREAFGKYTGEGFFGPRPDLVQDGQLVDRVRWQGTSLWLHEIPLAGPWQAALVTPEEDTSFLQHIR